MPDKHNRPVAWSLVLDYLEDGLKADAELAAVLTKTRPDSTTYVDVAQGETAQIPPLCIRLKRATEGGQPLTTFRGWGDELPPKIIIDVEIYAQGTTVERDKGLTARPAYAALRDLEGLTLAALRRLFAPEIDTEALFGAPYCAEITTSAASDASWWPVVASVHTIVLNKGK